MISMALRPSLMSPLKCEAYLRALCSEETAASWFVGLARVAPPAQTPSSLALELQGQAAHLGSSSGPSTPLAAATWMGLWSSAAV